MPLQPIPGFQSLETHHCVTGSMLHVYQFHDCPISEELLLGIGAGVGFIYWHMGDFRYMYGRFLREAAAITGEERLAEVAGEMVAVGDRWEDVARLFQAAHTAPDPAALLPEAAALVRTIADREQAAWERLRCCPAPPRTPHSAPRT